MKAIVKTSDGGPEVLKLSEVETPKPKSTQLFSAAPNPNDLDNKKKFLTTPSGIKNEINKLNIVPISIPTSITKKIRERKKTTT